MALCRHGYFDVSSGEQLPVPLIWRQTPLTEVGDVGGDGVDAVAVFVDLGFLGVFVVRFDKSGAAIGGQFEEHFGGDGDDVFDGVEDVTVFDGFEHGVAVEGHPEFFALGVAAEFAKTCQGVVVGSGGEADDEVLFGAGAIVGGVGVEGGLQFVEDADHFFALDAAVGAVDFVDEEDDAHGGEALEHFGVEHFLDGAEFLQVDDDDARVGFDACWKVVLVRFDEQLASY